MSLTIKPGYDFEVTETPTRDKLLRQARGLDISGIDASFLDANLIAHKTTNSSAVTLPAEGWLWTDGGGNSWVQTARGPVRFFRSGGGWESRRYQFFGATYQQGNKLDVTGGAEEASVTLRADTTRVDDGGVYSFVAHETCVTGAYPVAVGRGAALLSFAASTDWYWQIKTLVRTYGADGLNWANPLDYASHSQKAFPVALLGHNFANSLAYGWFFGRNIYGPGSTL